MKFEVNVRYTIDLEANDPGAAHVIASQYIENYEGITGFSIDVWEKRTPGPKALTSAGEDSEGDSVAPLPH